MTTTITDPADQIDGRRIVLAGGLPGFPGLGELVLTAIDEFGIFVWADHPDDEIAFLVANPFIYFPDYEVELSDVAQGLLNAGIEDELIVYCFVSIDRETEAMTVNLLAPLVVNVTEGLACQVVLDGDLELRAPLPHPYELAGFDTTDTNGGHR